MADVATSTADLKYLGFFKVAVIKAVAYLSSLYEYAKESSGALKSGLDRVEATVKTVVGPVYVKLENKPDEFLVFVDKKVDTILTAVEQYMPDYIKGTGAHVYDFAKAAPDNTKAVYSKIKEIGLLETGKVYYDQYAPVVADYAHIGWMKFLTLPLAPQLVKVVTPSALYASEKYNSVADYLKENETSALKTVGSFLPKVPVSDMKKTLEADTDAALKGKKIE